MEIRLGSHYAYYRQLNRNVLRYRRIVRTVPENRSNRVIDFIFCSVKKIGKFSIFITRYRKTMYLLFLFLFANSKSLFNHTL